MDLSRAQRLLLLRLARSEDGLTLLPNAFQRQVIVALANKGLVTVQGLGRSWVMPNGKERWRMLTVTITEAGRGVPR